MKAKRTHQVKDVSRIARVSVRTLHYYEEIGLLVPTARTDAGYRLYTDDDLLRLQQILIGRELGLPLEAIRRSLDDPMFDHRQALRNQKQELLERARQTAAMIAAVDAALAIVESAAESNLGRLKAAPTRDFVGAAFRRPEIAGEGTMESIFQGFDHAKHESEAREKWGGTDAYKEASRRTKGYTKADWDRHKSEQEAIYRDAAALMQRGIEPSSDDGTAIAERHRLLIDQWFYPCSREMHAGLASLYESDQRFADGMNAHAPGLAAFLVAAIRATQVRDEPEQAENAEYVNAEIAEGRRDEPVNAGRGPATWMPARSAVHRPTPLRDLRVLRVYTPRLRPLSVFGEPR